MHASQRIEPAGFLWTIGLCAALASCAGKDSAAHGAMRTQSDDAGHSNTTSDASAAAETDGSESAGAGKSPCVITKTSAECHSKSIEMITSGSDTRRIYWNEPAGTPPKAGWPGVVLFQGTLYGPSTSWDTALARDTTPFGGDVQVMLVATLIDHGFSVVQPEAQNGLAWNTNNGSAYATTPDAVFIPKLLSAIEHGTFGVIDMQRLYATGISSGGYMTSRMAVSYAGTFRALAIESGAYATCLGPICTTPSQLPSDHPPTLFLHGDKDTTVPIATARAYFKQLQASGVQTKFIEDANADHRWISAAPNAVLAWFMTH